MISKITFGPVSFDRCKRDSRFRVVMDGPGQVLLMDENGDVSDIVMPIIGTTNCWDFRLKADVREVLLRPDKKTTAVKYEYMDGTGLQEQVDPLPLSATVEQARLTGTTMEQRLREFIKAELTSRMQESGLPTYEEEMDYDVPDSDELIMAGKHEVYDMEPDALPDDDVKDDVSTSEKVEEESEKTEVQEK